MNAQTFFTPFVACVDINLYWKIVVSSLFIILYASVQLIRISSINVFYLFQYSSIHDPTSFVGVYVTPPAPCWSNESLHLD